jgi:hypothetical protein
MVVAGDYAYLVGEGRLHIVDVSDPAAPKEAISYDALNSANDVAVTEDYVYVADGVGGLLILRLDNDL